MDAQTSLGSSRVLVLTRAGSLFMMALMDQYLDWSWKMLGLWGHRRDSFSRASSCLGCTAGCYPQGALCTIYTNIHQGTSLMTVAVACHVGERRSPIQCSDWRHSRGLGGQKAVRVSVQWDMSCALFSNSILHILRAPATLLFAIFSLGLCLAHIRCEHNGVQAFQCCCKRPLPSSILRCHAGIWCQFPCEIRLTRLTT